jgi:hypothetical protein
MDKFLLEMVERIAGSQFSGHWLLLCKGGAAYRLVFGRTPSEAYDDLFDTPSFYRTPDEAAKAAIADELPGLFDTVDRHVPSTRFMGCGRGDD